MGGPSGPTPSAPIAAIRPRARAMKPGRRAARARSGALRARHDLRPMSRCAPRASLRVQPSGSTP
ncbi:DUF6053 domain-containing protein [Lysobacter enzymogenes]|uniref:DUF6053 domain-containing protein n=1 Tax=Lysobacter enzymogenes TaxID=69 RepID=UPI003D188602